MRKNSVKMIRINREFQRELSSLISMEVKDPRISPVTSVVSVDVAPDLKTSKVYISVLGDQKAQHDTLEGLKSAASFLRSQLAHNLNLRNTPELHFYVDQSIEYGVNMMQRIDEVIAEDEAAYGHDEEPDTDDEDYDDYDESDDPDDFGDPEK
ncbi:MAG: 30S ribosome-binding factor RbfA [Lachnospiraceae bacterium]|nr:30S ribosome-binding factor RbfA [Lachnospiraceae bacterium]MCR5768384.1 30S ribosome-binding factor RbfA [Lachnospiraceae bacterium]